MSIIRERLIHYDLTVSEPANHLEPAMFESSSDGGRRILTRVLAGISIDALGAARVPALLVAAGFEVTVVCSGHLAVRRSRSVSRFIETGCAPSDVHAGIEAEIAANPDRYARVFIVDEPLLRTFVNQPASPELARLAAPTANPVRLGRLLSKVWFNIDCAAAGIPVPAFRVMGDPDELRRMVWTGKPFVVKQELSMSGSGVFAIRCESDLLHAQRSITAGPLLHQDFVDGRVGGTSVLYSKGEPKCWFSYFLCRNWPNALGASSALGPFFHPSLEPIIRQLGEMSGFDGLCGLDWVLDDQGNPLVLEMNPRPTPGLHLAPRVGVSFPDAIRDWIDGKDITQRPDRDATGLCRMFPQNLFRAIDDHDPGEFLRTFQDAPWRDPRLLLAYLRRVFTHYLPADLRTRAKRLLGR